MQDDRTSYSGRQQVVENGHPRPRLLQPHARQQPMAQMAFLAMDGHVNIEA